MPKVVDVILRGQLKASYRVSFAMLNSPTTEQDFIGYAALGFAYFEVVVSGWSEFRADDLERTETFAKKALALDPATTRAYHVLSQVYRLMRSMNSCACRKLHPAIFMMKPAEDRLSCDLAEPLDRPMTRRILVERQMRSEVIVIKGIGRKNPAQMCLAKEDDVIEAFATDRADQSLRMPVLPG